MNALAARRRHPAAIAMLLLAGLLFMGGAYAFFSPKDANASSAPGANQIAQGKDLFIANCASCHGVDATGTPDGPSLAGVGAASVDFQVGTGRMPLTLPGVQAPKNTVKFTQTQINAMAAFVASLAPGPAIPDEKWTTVIKPGTAENNEAIAQGGEIFRVNCAMCHNFAGSGGALTRGKYAPALTGVTPTHLYEAMVTGPQSMPVFSDTNLTPESKQKVISYLAAQEEQPQVGGMSLGNMGPVADGFFAWLFFLPILIGAAVWLGKKAA